MEVNPGTVTEEKAAAWKKYGVNRLSIGLQSVNDDELKMLGRIHAYEQFLITWEIVRRTGFENVNIDLISAIPGQTLRSWERTLRTVADLKPEHISAYSLIVEEGTPFYEQYGESAEERGQSSRKHGSALSAGQDCLPPLPDEDTEREIYKATEKILAEYGYHRYEVSNYAKEGYECRHNLGYWERKEYLGLGLGASSLISECRFHNTADMQNILNFTESLLQIWQDWRAVRAAGRISVKKSNIFHRKIRWKNLCFSAFARQREYPWKNFLQHSEGISLMCTGRS